MPAVAQLRRVDVKEAATHGAYAFSERLMMPSHSTWDWGSREIVRHHVRQTPLHATKAAYVEVNYLPLQIGLSR